MNSKIIIKHPIGIQWKIAQTLLQESIKEYLDSDSFDISSTDVRYFVRIFPNDDKITSIFFNQNYSEKHKGIKAEITISIETANFTQKVERHLAESWESLKYTIDELFNPGKRFIFNGEMVIKVDGFLMIETDAPLKLCKPGNSENSLGLDLWKQENKDFIIVADEKEIYAHKCILSIRSPVFAAMLKPHTKEAQEGKVVISDFSFYVVKTAIKLCYDSRLVETILLDDQILLVQFFDKYDIQSLKIELEYMMISEVDEFNVCRLANSAIFSNALNLKEKCGEVLEQCFRENKLLNDFDDLNMEFSHQMMKKSFYKISR